MTTGTPPPLSVDPEQLSAAGTALRTSAGQLPAAPAPFMPVGGDLLSVAIIGQIPAVEGPIMTQLPLVKTEAEATAQNIIDSARMYVAADQQNGSAIEAMMQNSGSVPGASGAGRSASPASSVSPSSMASPGSMASPAGGGADSMSQMMSMPMQVMGAVAAVPQGIMQGAQQVGQQVQQMAGQFGQGGTGASSGQPSSASGQPGGGLPEIPMADQQQPPADAPRDGETDEKDGAAAGRPDAERAPDAKTEADENSTEATPPGRHRAAEADEGINL